jgi:nucleotide-binding universal stress UspA family protein
MRNILVAYDGSPGAELALERVAQFAEKEAKIHLLAVGRIPEYAETVSEVDEAKESAMRHYEKDLEMAKQKLQQAAALDVTTHLDFGKPSEVIIRKAEELVADLIVVGTNPHSTFKRRVVGSTADKIVDSAHCSVLVVRPRVVPAK